jgi:hypothetical protein
MKDFIVVKLMIHDLKFIGINVPSIENTFLIFRTGDNLVYEDVLLIIVLEAL